MTNYRVRRYYIALPQATALAHAHWKLWPPRCPVTSTTSPMKYSPETFLASRVFEESSSVSTPPFVTSAVRKPSVPAGLICHSLTNNARLARAASLISARRSCLIWLAIYSARRLGKYCESQTFGLWRGESVRAVFRAVSYTHLTLPTICSV